MAGLATGKDGLRRVTFNWQGKPKVVRLGRMGDTAAKAFQTHVGAIVAARGVGVPLEPSTVKWLAGLADDLHARLAATGLVESREAKKTHTLGELLTAFFDAADVRPATLVTMKQVRPSLEEHFGDRTDVATITARGMAEWRSSMVKSGLAAATVSKRVKVCRQIFGKGVKWGMIAENPTLDLRAGDMTNPDGRVFVDREIIAKVIDAAPDPEWRLLIALGRYGGLRVPSEALAMKWADVLWDVNRIRVASTKTGTRIVPLFPELAEPLHRCFDVAEEGAEYVIARHRAHRNMNIALRRIIEQAGIEAWPNTWRNLRASRATELAQQFPGHVAAAWLGHSEAIADAHYRMVRDEDFDRAAKPGVNKSGNEASTNPAMHQTAHHCTTGPESTQTPTRAGFVQAHAESCSTVQKQTVTPTGFEPVLPG
ncbi:MAG: site-specific integrase [Leptolyngbya sp. PLA3]|nr:MAG: site-specific integrase [Cyanobacteria bacterium CYA]MCE7968806.1 site-specific integrase [Leptolyngbya sp. PL-A3]